MEPTVSRIVLYTLTEQDVLKINKRRQDAVDAARALVGDGVQVHYGNSVEVGDVLPMVIIKVWSGGSVNGQLFLDGNDSYWVTSVSQAIGGTSSLGRWNWPTQG